MPRVRPEDWRPTGVDELEPEAWLAIREWQRSVLVTAGPGAGKTEFLAQKILYLLQTGICRVPQRILAISFKRDAARNLAERVRRRAGAPLAGRLDSLTFDAFAKSLVDRFRYGLPPEWRPSRNYRIVHPTREVYREFVDKHALGMNPDELEKGIARTSVGITKTGDVIFKWWKEMLSQKPSTLTFAMLNRLALLVLEHNERVCRALRLTYPFVMLDEFQDTTGPQFELLFKIFQGSGTKLTAVGDELQRIMVWAGAMPDAFERFEQTFGAQRFRLEWNWRVPQDLAELQKFAAQRILRTDRLTLGRGSRSIEGNAVEIWVFASESDEAEGLASWIADECRNRGRRPDQFVVIVRQRAETVEKRIGGAFARVGLSLRNLARQVGDKKWGTIDLQQLLCERYAELLKAGLRVGIRRDPKAWEVLREFAIERQGVPEDDERSWASLRELQDRLTALRRELGGKGPEKFESKQLLQRLEDVVGGRREIRLADPSYRDDREFCRVREGFLVLLVECLNGATDWGDVIERIEGAGQIALMTIHKAKGLEFETVIFYGLDEKEWWSLKEGKPDSEEYKNFYVALSRAKERAIFTRAEARGRPIKWIEQILQEAGVPVRYKDVPA